MWLISPELRNPGDMKKVVAISCEPSEDIF